MVFLFTLLLPRVLSLAAISYNLLLLLYYVRLFITSKNCNSLESTFAYMRRTVHLPPMKDKGSSVLTA